jgi:hypothetical protein
MRRLAFVGCCALVVAAVVFLGRSTLAGDSPKSPDQAALNRTRKQVKMLDDIYKSVVVTITSKYVKKEEDYPAGRAIIHLFKAINDKGWHEVRLLDVSGQPSNPMNVARDTFEKNGVQAMKGGKQYYEQLEEANGKSYLRAMTFVPVVMDRCILCHANYKDAKKGEAIGAISYRLEVE